MMFRLTAFVTALVLSPCMMAQPEFVQLIAGRGVPGNQPGLSANLGAVGGVAVDKAGNVYLSLSNYGIIEKLDSSGTLSRFAGTATPGFAGDGGSALAAQFSAPGALAFDSAGNLYIADTGNHRVRKIAASTLIVTTVAGGGGQSESSESVPATSVALGQLGGLTADSAGNLYVASGCRIHKVSVAGGLISSVVGIGVCGFGGDKGPALAAQISLPTALALDSAGNLYLTDGNRVRGVDARTGNIETLAGTGNAGFGGDLGPATAATLSGPLSIAVDSKFNIFIADTANQRVRRIDGLTGVITTVAGNGTAGLSGDGGAATAARLNLPQSIALDANGNLLVADSGNGVIRRISASNSVISTIAGSGGASFGGDSGPAALAQFAGIRGLALDASGNLYLADTGNCRIRRIDALRANVSTVAGSGCGPFAGDNGPATSATLSAPGDVAVDSHGNLFIADTGNARVRKVNGSTGTITTVAGGGTGDDGGLATDSKLVSPDGLALDSADNLFISDAGDNRVRLVNAASGMISTAAGSGVAGSDGDGGQAKSARLNHPEGIALDMTGNLYIADNGNNRIRRVDAASGVITNFAGTGQSGFSGDSGPAINATLASPRGVAVDFPGNVWIADEANNRIRMVAFTTGVISTVAGDGNQNSSGDGGTSTSAELNLPWGLTISPSDHTLFFSENGSSRVRALVPLDATLSCTVSVIPPSFTASPSGGSATLYLLSSSLACPWSVSDLPDWISAFPASGAGPATLVLTAAANTGTARTATVGVARTTVQVAQAALTPACTYAISPITQAYPSTGGSGSIAVNTTAGCSWQIDGAPSWLNFSGAISGSGPASVAFTVPVNTGAVRTAAFTIAGQNVRVDQYGATASPAGTFTHVVSGGGWVTGFVLANTGYGDASGGINFYDETGKPFPGATTSAQPGSPVTAAAANKMAPGSVLWIAAPDESASTTQQGWAQLLTDGLVSGYEVFRFPVGQGFLEASVAPETRSSSVYMLPFDTTGGDDYGIALVNPGAMDAVVTFTATDATTGALLASGNLTATSKLHTSFVLTANYPALANTRGVLKFSTFFAGQVQVLGLRIKPEQSITSVPVLTPGSANPFAGFVDAGVAPQIVSGGGWSTNFALVNTGSTRARAHLDFYGDDGSPLPLTLTQSIVGATAASIADHTDVTLEPGTMAFIEASGDTISKAGWAHMLAEGNVGGAVTLAYSDGTITRESAAPIALLAANAYLLPFDNTAGYVTGVGLANNSAQAATVTAIVRDSTGATLGTAETISLPAWGHSAFTVSGRYALTANISGTIEFSSAVSGQLGVVGIRAGANHAFTAVPALARQ